MGVMEQRPMVVWDIVVTCVVLYNMLRTYKGRADHQTHLSKWCSGCTKWTGGVCARCQLLASFEEGQISVRPTERLLHSAWYNGWTDGQNLRWELPWDRRSWHLSVLFRTVQLFQEVLFELLLLLTNSPPPPTPKKSNTFPKSPIHFQQVSKLFPTKSQFPQRKFSHIKTPNWFT